SIHDPQLPRFRPRGSAGLMLPDRISRRTNRSRLRRSTIVRRFSHHLLHRSRTGIIVRSGSGWRNSRLPARLAQTVAQSTLRALSKRLALFSRARSILSLQRTLAPFHSLDACARLARSAGGAPTGSAFPHQSAARCAQSLDHSRAHERVSKLSLSLRREARLRSDRHLREPARRKDVRALRIQGFESGRDHEVQGVLSRIGLLEHRHQEPRDGRAAFRLYTRARLKSP